VRCPVITAAGAALLLPLRRPSHGARALTAAAAPHDRGGRATDAGTAGAGELPGSGGGDARPAALSAPAPPCFQSILSKPQIVCNYELYADVLESGGPRLPQAPQMPCGSYCRAMGLQPLCSSVFNLDYAPGTRASTLRDWALKRAQVSGQSK
jgi:hypothetical protein